ncbi:bifunctional diaminohydroxyphosphoribosylaminopyrimidine deaminase/5-amino-6-(5-phosphoribosylamino)uracil reductase RibD [Chitinimonas sp. BJB300]|uniref:bifunctional diaminohydroxyphosphoribosylaminopyrimidine deaminase/5-amino-6-(5-phosphoribosylamino)uracil reductase RibD n=1 Tax=Chitinimonas sp. BJB300 TaxID=1559339 RepID=UPI000C0DC23C|nr:bifunctional diaminohydroxyphosphoribosylaminopyrimidine deaminase/5-amino-6-(5-phosphoribosylamino)uracil reductase RibD [Chitinimonas sp. BJB300]PHV13191.1 riboflavin biosynthesis protein RibD [Chitinimonas sp. BJB300]TSJ87175.1 bifunctional diaminohydroxyphosphoribosylaminopyrimidine deaminase/5-amino-6-(5-phosphoribosylamino)uracil reductase RibD [Chitinimonas sp. BJB300]
MSFSVDDHQYMALALRLAERGRCISTPNPAVGAVLVRDGRIIGQGFTQQAGGPHAEVMALRDAAAAGESTVGATAYVTLEPCAHFGRTPPCAQGLIDAGLSRVVVALQDPNPLVAGKGMAMLREAGVDVALGLLALEASESLKGFLSRIERGRPWLRLKIAASLDGKTALANGESQWITGPAARMDVQRLRARSCAMLTGSGTVLKDDPLLTVREVDGQPWQGRQPLRVVLDSRAQLSPQAKLLHAPGHTLVITANAPAAHIAALQAAGAEVLALPDANARVDLSATLVALAARGINEVTVEAGARLNGAWLQSGLVDEIIFYQAPVLLGSAAAGLADFSLDRLADKLAPSVTDIRHLGADLRYTLRFKSSIKS